MKRINKEECKCSRERLLFFISLSQLPRLFCKLHHHFEAQSVRRSACNWLDGISIYELLCLLRISLAFVQHHKYSRTSSCIHIVFLLLSVGKFFLFSFASAIQRLMWVIPLIFSSKPGNWQMLEQKEDFLYLAERVVSNRHWVF